MEDNIANVQNSQIPLERQASSLMEIIRRKRIGTDASFVWKTDNTIGWTGYKVYNNCIIVDTDPSKVVCSVCFTKYSTKLKPNSIEFACPPSSWLVNYGIGKNKSTGHLSDHIMHQHPKIFPLLKLSQETRVHSFEKQFEQDYVLLATRWCAETYLPLNTVGIYCICTIYRLNIPMSFIYLEPWFDHPDTARGYKLNCCSC